MTNWPDTDQLDEAIGPLSPADYEMDGSVRPRFWWANQSKNYRIAMEQGSLWAPEYRADGRPAHEDWTALHDMLPGDVVFHYAGQKLQAVSQVQQAATRARRPPGHEPATGSNEGPLVLVTPLVEGIEIRLASLRKVIGPGVGPMNRLGVPGRTYISPLPPGLGSKLALCLGAGPVQQPGIDASPSSSQYLQAPVPPQLPTDIQVIASQRAEQRYLRAVLLAGGNSRCSLCGRQLPAALLVAAHIKPRAECNDDERLDFRAAAMLACTLGCDALFEHGFMAVDVDGVIHAAESGHPDLQDVLRRLNGNPCPAHSAATAPNFQSHWRSKFLGQHQ
ncbi:hypothetical protein ACFQ36_02930 [Arthrobacter sp. GCM10027362]|uniref:hypothetical protein n=1 Tax=Arthrobacter sp. GCM10027362 TaxID=3273379 RepID=UPI00362A0889